jgi:putative ABC transport system ATP-binding protein
MAELEVRDLTVEFASGGYMVRPLDKLSFDANDGELVVVLGPSGCGKTTLLSCLAGLLTPTSGTISFRGTDIAGLAGPALGEHRRSTVGVVFQAFNLIPSLSARGNVMAPMRLARVPRREASARADELLAQVGLADRADHRPGQMSGGQQQRVAIARALVHEPPLVVADEPTAHLDHIQVEGVLTLVRALATSGRLVLVFSGADREPEEVCLEAGQVLFHQGERGDLVYAVEEGEIEIYRIRAAGAEETVAVIGAGNYFGELGPMFNLPRSASARARTPSRLTACSLRAFRRRFPAATDGSASAAVTDHT